MNRKKIKERWEEILTLLPKGLSESEIAKALRVSQSTVSRDIQEMKEESKDYVNDIAKYFGYYYRKAFEGINQVRREAWIMYQNENNAKVKLDALSLAKDCYESEFNLLADGPTVLSVERLREKHEKVAKGT